MIRALQTEQDARSFFARIQGQLYFQSAMGMRLALFGQKPGSGWRFCLTDGGALMLRGNSAQLCGACRDADEGEELASFLRFCGVETLLCRGGHNLPPDWPSPQTRTAFRLARGESLPGMPPQPDLDTLRQAAPDGMTFDPSPRVGEAAKLLFADREEQEQFYSDSCTAIAHGMGQTWTLRTPEGTLAATVSCCADYGGEAYVAAGMTAPDWQGRGLGAWLIAAMMAYKARTAKALLLCEPSLCGFYKRMGLQQGPDFLLYTLPQ